jgi:tRNA (guanine-N7-)-methyltransferase
MSRVIPRDVEGPDWRAWPEEIRRGDWAELFDRTPGAPLRLNLDIGFGDGQFLMATARRDPEGVYVGIEIAFKRVLKVARKLACSGITNVRLVCVDAEWVITEALADESVAKAWINFPDPWPRRRHERRRIVAPRLIQTLSRRLIVGGALAVATDSAEYAKTIRSVLERESLLDNLCAPTPYRSEGSDPVQTRFQRGWAAQGRRCAFFEYQRRAVARVKNPEVARVNAHV